MGNLCIPSFTEQGTWLCPFPCCCTIGDILSCPWNCLVFPLGMSTNCCCIGIPPCGYNPIVLAPCCVPCRYRTVVQDDAYESISLLTPGSRRKPNKSLGILTSVPAIVDVHPQAEVTLILTHGNGQDIEFLSSYVRAFLRKGLQTPCNIICLEYPGYATNQLPTNEWFCLKAAVAGYKFAKSRFPHLPIVPFGISLGTGPAAYIAYRFEVKGLILQSPYTSIASTVIGFDCAKTVQLGDLFKTWKIAPEISVPVKCIHGRRDQVVPSWCSEILCGKLVNGKACSFPNALKPVFCEAGHNDVIQVMGDDYTATVDDFLQRYVLTDLL